MYSYTAYGLDIHSAFSLPELIASAKDTADVFIKTEKFNWSPPAINNEGTYFHVTSKEAYLFWDNVGTFIVRDGKEIIINPRPDVEQSIIRLPLFGTVMAVLLHQRGFLVLHASAVSLGDSAIAFIGDKGQGKSTMAATLYGLGHNLIADDVVAVDFDSTGSPRVVSSFPLMKLWPEAAIATLGDDPQTLAKIHPQVEKRSRSISERFVKASLPLERVYTLTHGGVSVIKSLPPQEAIKELIRNSYMARFGKQFLQGHEAAWHFHKCIKLANNIPVLNLERPRNLDLLPDVARLVEEDLVCKIN